MRAPSISLLDAAAAPPLCSADADVLRGCCSTRLRRRTVGRAANAVRPAKRHSTRATAAAADAAPPGPALRGDAETQPQETCLKRRASSAHSARQLSLTRRVRSSVEHELLLPAMSSSVEAIAPRAHRPARSGLGRASSEREMREDAAQGLINLAAPLGQKGAWSGARGEGQLSSAMARHSLLCCSAGAAPLWAGGWRCHVAAMRCSTSAAARILILLARGRCACALSGCRAAC